MPKFNGINTTFYSPSRGRFTAADAMKDSGTEPIPPVMPRDYSCKTGGIEFREKGPAID
jgi:hypothetical protein